MTSDRTLSVEQRILARAAVAGFDMTHAGHGHGDGVIAVVLDRLAYIGALAVEAVGMDGHGSESDERPYAADASSDERHGADIRELSARIETQGVRLSLARVVVATAELVLREGIAVRQGVGSAASAASALEMLGSALDAFTEADESLPRVDV